MRFFETIIKRRNMKCQNLEIINAIAVYENELQKQINENYPFVFETFDSMTYFLKKKIQFDYLTKVYQLPSHGVPDYGREHPLNVFNYEKKVIDTEEIDLNKQIVIAFPWNKNRMKNVNKYIDYFKFDRINHFVARIEPFGFYFAYNGNHSIARGIKLNKGKLYCNEVWDFTEELSHYKVTENGYYDEKNENYADIIFDEFAILFNLYKNFNVSNEIKVSPTFVTDKFFWDLNTVFANKFDINIIHDSNIELSYDCNKFVVYSEEEGFRKWLVTEDKFNELITFLQLVQPDLSKETLRYILNKKLYLSM